MEALIKIEGEALAEFMKHCVWLIAHHDDAFRLRIAVDDGQLKMKIDEHIWTPPLGAVAVGEDAR